MKLVMTILKCIEKELKSGENADFAHTSQNFFKENVKMRGLRTAEVDKIAKKYFKCISGLGKDEVFNLCEKLWQTGFQEESHIACEWSYRMRGKYMEKDIGIFESWITKYIDNWAKCDTFCNHTVGAFLESYPKYIQTLKTWAKSSNRWLKRASAVSLIVPLKKGLFRGDIFEISDILIGSEDDLVQKGYGWALKVYAGVHRDDVCDFLRKKVNIMPRTAYRYAVEKMPKDVREYMMSLGKYSVLQGVY